MVKGMDGSGSETDHADFHGPPSTSGPAQLILRGAEGIEIRTLGEGDQMTFGRSRSASYPIPDSRVSRLHAQIRVEEGAIWVEDLDSRNGTLVGRYLLRKAERRAFGGDLVRIGPLEVVVAQLGGGCAQPDRGGPDGIVVADPSMRHVFEVARRLSQTQTTVLIVGETGSGKEVVAGQIHRWSARAAGPFVRLGCASVPPAVLEAELFGVEPKRGFFHAANGGTLLLDEIGELSPEVQTRLLSFLEHPGGDDHRLDVRILCATHRDLDEDVRKGRFRQDLYYRINTFTLRVPPLRERPEEILLLADHHARAIGRTMGVSAPTIDPQACAALAQHVWPGNVRELRNAIEHAIVLASDGVIRTEHLPDSVIGRPSPAAEDPGKLVDRIADVERQTIQEALRLEKGNQTRAARRLGITRRALVYRIDRLGLRGE